MLLSIIIPMYNAEAYIGACLDSILNQGLNSDNYEIIIVNDGSVDKSQEVVQPYLNLYDNILLFCQDNKGQSAARNIGISKARGRYIQFVDADDFLIRDSLHQIADFALSTEDKGPWDMITFGITGGKLEGNIKNNGEGKCLWYGNGQDYIESFNYNNSLCYYWLSQPFVDKNGLRFEEGKLCEDGMFTLTALVNAQRIAHLDSIVYFYAVRPNSTTTSQSPKRRKEIINGFIYAIRYFGMILNTKQLLGGYESGLFRPNSVQEG